MANTSIYYITRTPSNAKEWVHIVAIMRKSGNLTVEINISDFDKIITKRAGGYGYDKLTNALNCALYGTKLQSCRYSGDARPIFENLEKIGYFVLCVYTRL